MLLHSFGMTGHIEEIGMKQKIQTSLSNMHVFHFHHFQPQHLAAPFQYLSRHEIYPMQISYIVCALFKLILRLRHLLLHIFGVQCFHLTNEQSSIETKLTRSQSIKTDLVLTICCAVLYSLCTLRNVTYVVYTLLLAELMCDKCFRT